MTWKTHEVVRIIKPRAGSLKSQIVKLLARLIKSKGTNTKYSDWKRSHRYKFHRD